MRGYVCDRCGKKSTGEVNPRDGEYPPSGWLTVSVLAEGHDSLSRVGGHLCTNCRDAFDLWMTEQ